MTRASRFLFYALIPAVFFADIISKDAAFQTLEWRYGLPAGQQPHPAKVVPIIGSWLQFEAGLNTGISFSLLENNNQRLSLVMIAAIGLIFLVAHFMKRKPLIVYTALACILGGALGNLHDRFRYHGVRDFIKVPNFPIFNVADSAITVGAVLIIIFLIFEEKWMRALEGEKPNVLPESGGQNSTPPSAPPPGL